MPVQPFPRPPYGPYSPKSATSKYSTITGAQAALSELFAQPDGRTLPLPRAAIGYAQKTRFTGRDQVFLPCVMKEVEASAALKAIEAGVAAAIGELRFGFQEDDIEINMEQAAAFLFQVSGRLLRLVLFSSNTQRLISENRPTLPR